MIITKSDTEVIYFKVYKDYFSFPRNRTSVQNTTSSHCKKIGADSGIYFIEYDFCIIDDFTKEPFFVYRTKNSFTFTVENEEKDLIDLSFQKAQFRENALTFIFDNSLGYPFENRDQILPQHNSLDLIIGQGLYAKNKKT